MSDRKKRFLEKLNKAQENGWQPKDKLLIPKLECIADELFEEALDQSLNKGDSKKKD